jgi:CelD/BcsL family acetyltransferase involved in cellulose biosynthesis
METGRILGLDAFEREAARATASIAVPRPTPMLHDIWRRACARELNARGAFEVVAAKDGERSIAAAVFARRRSVFAPHLFLLGAEDLWEPADVLYENARGASALAEAVLERGLPVRFGHFPADSLFVAALKDKCPGKALLIADPVPGSPFIRLDESWREPEKKFKSRRQGDFRRMRRKAEGMGAVAADILAPRAGDVDALLEEAIAVEAGGWKARSRSALAYDEKAGAFFREYARLASEAGILRLAFLRIAGKAAATQIAVECDNAFWLLKIGYDDAYKDCSPGNLLMLETVRRAAGLGLSTFEFLGKAAPWTSIWTEEERPNIRLRIYPFNPAGVAAIAIDGAGAAARRASAFIQSKLSRKHAQIA